MIKRITNKLKRDGIISAIKSLPKALLRDFFNKLKKMLYEIWCIKFIISKESRLIRANGLHANIGCGEYELIGFISLDYFSEHYYGGKKFNRVKYDMRNDNLPFNNSTIDTIYCSHVIEHIETKYVEKFFNESQRVLKKSGVLRISVPDSKFLFNNLKKHPEYFSWHRLYKKKSDAKKCFVDEVATSKCDLNNFGLSKDFDEYEYEDLLRELRNGLIFNQDAPGHHINSWDFARLSGFAKKYAFSSITESRHQGSYCAALRGKDIDLSHREMSLYVDIQK